jgi:DNA-binding transcriptional LysR family regulator
VFIDGEEKTRANARGATLRADLFPRKRIALKLAINVSDTVPQALDIDLLRNFVAIADAGTLSQAARRVSRTQSALSMQVQRLESAVGHTLLHRNSRGVRLTAEGATLMGHALRLLRQHDEALADMNVRTVTGRLRIGCPDDYAVRYLPRLLKGFASQYPRAQIEVRSGSTPRLRSLLAKHLIDVALVSLTGRVRSADAIRMEPLVWVSHLGRAVIDDDPLPLALSEPDDYDHQAATAALDRVGRRYRLVCAANSLSTLTAIVRAGVAITVLTRTAVPDDLVVVAPKRGLPRLPNVGLTVAFDRDTPSVLAQRFGEHARQELSVP